VTRNHNFRKLYLFPPSGGREGIHLLCWVFWKELTSITGPNRVGVSPPSSQWFWTLAVWYRSTMFPLKTHFGGKLQKIRAAESLVIQAYISRVQPDNPSSVTVPVESGLCSLEEERKLISSLRRSRIPLLWSNEAADGHSSDLWPQESDLCFRSVRELRELCWQVPC
jgi:hypothetical protein